MKQIKVSVIVPVYNCEKYVGECLDSILRQTLEEIEIICINDGSTDRSLDILKSYAAKDSRVIVATQANKGLSASRNRGMEIAKGEFIQFCDSDDMLTANALEYSYNKAEEGDLDVFYFDAQSVFENQELKKRKASYNNFYKRKDKYNKTQTGSDLFVAQIHDSAFRTSACLQFTRRKFLNQTGIVFPVGLLHEDNYFTAAIMLCANRVCHESKAFYIRRVREDSIMTQKESFRNAYGYIMCANLLIEFMYSHKLASTAEKAMKSFIYPILSEAARVYLRIDPVEQEKIIEIDEVKRMYFILGASINHIFIPRTIIEKYFNLNPVAEFFINEQYRAIEESKNTIRDNMLKLLRKIKFHLKV